MPDPEVMPNFQLAVWQADGLLPIPLAVTDITTEIENTITKQKRPFVNGAKLDPLGRDVIVRTATVAFFNGCTEPGIPTEGYYPNYVTALENSIDVQKTGTMSLGRAGPVRGQIKHLRVVESSAERDFAAVTITFWEDREDTAVTASSFVQTSASALPVLGGDIYDTAIDCGIYSDDLALIASMTAAVADLLSTPADLLSDALALALNALAVVTVFEAAFTAAEYNTTLSPAASLLLDPDAAVLGLLCRRSRDRIGTVRGVLLARAPRTKTVQFTRVVSIFEVAATYGQEVDDLIALNTGKIDPGSFYAIPIGTTITVEDA